jgi:hypothetical protein
MTNQPDIAEVARVLGWRKSVQIDCWVDGGPDPAWGTAMTVVRRASDGSKRVDLTDSGRWAIVLWLWAAQVDGRCLVEPEGVCSFQTKQGGDAVWEINYATPGKPTDGELCRAVATPRTSRREPG